MQSNAYSVWEQIPIGLLFFFTIPYHPLLTKLNKSFNYKNQQEIFLLMLNCKYISRKIQSKTNKIPSSTFVIPENAEHVFKTNFLPHSVLFSLFFILESFVW